MRMRVQTAFEICRDDAPRLFAGETLSAVVASTRAMARIAVLSGVTFCLLCATADAQEAPPTPAPGRPITESADRIGRELWPQEMRISVDEQGRPRFRESIEVDMPPAPWVEGEMGIYWRPSGGSMYHYEYLRMMTPEAFRAGVLYPCCVSVDPGEIVNGIKSAWRSRQEQRVRERIRKEVEALAATKNTEN